MAREIPADSYVITVGDHTTEKMIRFGMTPSLQITDGLEKRRRRPHPELAESRGGGDNDGGGGGGDNRSRAVATTTTTTTAGDPHAPPKTTILEVANPPGEITFASIGAIRRAFSIRPPVRIHVDGEEDLLVIPACIHAPDNATVLYGQPDEGLVITVITNEVRNKMRNILALMGGT